MTDRRTARAGWLYMICPQEGSTGGWWLGFALGACALDTLWIRLLKTAKAMQDSARQCNTIKTAETVQGIKHKDHEVHKVLETIPVKLERHTNKTTARTLNF